MRQLVLLDKVETDSLMRCETNGRSISFQNHGLGVVLPVARIDNECTYDWYYASYEIQHLKKRRV